jgi:hypothetical protein
MTDVSGSGAPDGDVGVRPEGESVKWDDEYFEVPESEWDSMAPLTGLSVALRTKPPILGWFRHTGLQSVSRTRGSLSSRPG